MEFLDLYRKQMIDDLKILQPGLTDEEILEVLNEQINNNEIVNNTEEDLALYNYYDADYQNTSIIDLLNFIETEKPIITPFGGLFNQHKDSMNLNAKFIDYLKKERKVYKKLQFESLNNGDKVMEKFYERFQKTFKLLNNSYYGTTGLPASFFYDPLITASVTYSGHMVITTSIIAFERILANNIKYESFSQLLDFIADRASNDFNYFKILNKDILDISDSDLIEYLKTIVSFELTEDNIETLKTILCKFNINQKFAIYYTNNLYKFMADTVIKDYLKDIFKNPIINPKEIDDKTKETFDTIYDIIDKAIVYKKLCFNKDYIVDNLNRKAILGCDTDSNFIYIDPFYDFVKENFNICDYKDNPNLHETIANVIVIILSKFIQDQLNLLTASCNIEEEKRPIINMKSEFLFDRMMFTRNKKQYCSIVSLQECNIINPPKFDIKGLSIRKATVNNRTKEVLSEILENDILNSIC